MRWWLDPLIALAKLVAVLAIVLNSDSQGLDGTVLTAAALATIGLEYVFVLWRVCGGRLSWRDICDALPAWLIALPILLCCLQVSVGTIGNIAVSWLGIPFAAVLGRRLGTAALAPIAGLLSPMLLTLAGRFGTTGSVGIMLTARLVAETRLRQMILYSAARMRPDQSAVIFLLLPLSIGTGLAGDSYFTVGLFPVAVLLLFLIGQSRVPVRPML